MNRVLARLLALAAAGLLAFPLSAAAQMTRGAISGSVRDAQGALVPGATITVTNVATNSTRSAVSDAEGFYRVPALEPGTYHVKTELSGFQSVENKDIRLTAASEVTLNVDLKVAGREPGGHLNALGVAAVEEHAPGDQRREGQERRGDVLTGPRPDVPAEQAGDQEADEREEDDRVIHRSLAVRPPGRPRGGGVRMSLGAREGEGPSPSSC